MKSSHLGTYPLMIDLRNLYLPGTVTNAGLCYASIGRPLAIPYSTPEKQLA